MFPLSLYTIPPSGNAIKPSFYYAQRLCGSKIEEYSFGVYFTTSKISARKIQIAEKFSNICGLESRGHFFIHMFGIWAKRTQRLGLAGIVDQPNYIYIYIYTPLLYKLIVSHLLAPLGKSHVVSSRQDEDFLQTRGTLHGLLGPHLRGHTVSLFLYYIGQIAQSVKNLPAVQETRV